MEIKKSDYRKVFISAARKPVQPIVLLESEWLTLQGKRVLGQQLTNKTRSSLLKVTNIYASSWREPEQSESLKTIRKKIDDWRADTSRLRIAIWKKPTDHNSRQELERSKLIKKITNGEIDLDDIIGRHFYQAPSKHESIYPLARFDRLLKGSIAISDFIAEEIGKDTGPTPAAKLWFLWAATVFAILNNAGVPIKNPNRKELLTGPVIVLEKLQSKLPLELQRRQGKYQTSLRKGAVNAYKMRPGNDIAFMQKLLARWAKGNFSTDFGGTVHPMTSGGFLARFDDQMSKATKHAQGKSKRTSAI
jgi:hypothetical protein